MWIKTIQICELTALRPELRALCLTYKYVPSFVFT